MKTANTLRHIPLAQTAVSPLSSTGTSSTVDAQKTNEQLTSDGPQGATTASRAKRDLMALAASPGAITPGALVLNGDSEMALLCADEMAASYAYTLINGEAPGEENIRNIPALSTFGIAWAKLGQALGSEPFTTFARNNGIDPSTVQISTRTGDLNCVANDRPRTFSLRDNSGWSSASSAVLAAAGRLTPGHDHRIDFKASDKAPLNIVSHFYNLNLDANPHPNGRLYAIKYLNTLKTFHGNRTAESPHGFSQHQRAAIDYVNGLTQAQRDELSGANIEQTPAQRVDADDQRLARLCSRSMIGSAFKTRDINESQEVINEIPEYSTFGQAQKQFRHSLSTAEFKTFITEQGIDLSSVTVDPVTGSLICKARGKDTVFSLNDLSGWSDIASPIVEAAARLTAGKSDGASYSTLETAPLSLVLRFYGEVIAQGGVDQVFQKVTQLNNNSFSAFAPTAPGTHERFRAVREQQQALKQTLANTLPPPHVALPESTPLPAKTRASGDSELAVLVGDMMQALKRDNSSDASRMLENIPAHSTFGQWWEHICNAFEGRALNEWMVGQKVDADTLVFDPAINALKAKADGVDRVFFIKDFAHDFPELFDALTPLAAAANVLVPYHQPIMIAKPTSATTAPFGLVFNFYGGDIGDLSSPGFIKLAGDMKRAKAFPVISENPERSEAALKNQKTTLGNHNDRYALISRLDAALSGSRLANLHLQVDSHSSHPSKGYKTAEAFITENGWKAPQTREETLNLLLALRVPVPQREPLADLWGFLSTPVPLTATEREAVVEVVNTQPGATTGLFNSLAPSSATLGTNLKQNLEHLLSSEKAQALGQALQTQLKGFPTPTSIRQWVLTALVLELDPKADEKRNSIAGFDFMDRSHWGRPASEVQGKFNQHLTNTHKIGSSIAPTAAYVLLSGKAPQFLVKELPTTLTYGTPAWANFCTAVNRIEQMAPGAAPTMTYKQVMDFGAIRPISAVEETHLARAQMNPILDWGIVNGVIEKNEKDQYTLVQLQACQNSLNQQIRETTAARDFLRTTIAPARRSMTLEALTKEFGTGIDFEAKDFEKKKVLGLFSGVPASIADIYETNGLDDDWFNNSPSSHRIPLEKIKRQSHNLPTINEAFETAIEQDFSARKTHMTNIIKNLFSKLELDDRKSLVYGKSDYYMVRKTDTANALGSISLTGARGNNGIIIRSTFNGVVKDFGVFPMANSIEKISNLPTPMPLGGTQGSFGFIFGAGDEGERKLPLDFNAFSSTTEPTPGATSDVLVYHLLPQHYYNGEMVDAIRRPMPPNLIDANKIPKSYDNAALNDIATTVVDSHFLVHDIFKRTQRGSNPLETAETPLEWLGEAIRIIPGVSSIEDIYQGNYLDAVRDLVIDAASIALTGGAAKVWSLVEESVTRSLVTGAEKAILKPLYRTFYNSASGIEMAASKDVSVSAISGSTTRLARLQGSHPDEALTALKQRPDISEGTVSQQGNAGQLTRVTAGYKEGNWYTYDVETKNFYGTPKRFTSDASIPLNQETFSDGTQALVTGKPLSEQAYTIRRSNGLDVVDAGKVYRYDSKTPDRLIDLESAANYRSPTDIEAFCPAPSVNRSRRETAALCFTKMLSHDLSPNAQLIQALEHQRFFPSKGINGEAPSVIRDRRIYNIENETFIPIRTGNKPIIYENTVMGTIKNDRRFGIVGDTTFSNIEENTAVVRFGAISKSVADQREVRGLIIETKGPTPEKYVVAEADTGIFYARKFGESSGAFTKATMPLINLYNTEKEALYASAGIPKKPNLYQLPTYKSLVEKLKNNGVTETELKSLDKKTSKYTDIQKREFLNEVYSKAYGRDGKVALAPIQALPLKKPANFDSLSAFEKNEFYAKGSVKAVNEQMAATGLGAGNKLTPTPADFERQALASDVVSWLRSKPNWDKSIKMDQILTSGAGNCGEMAQVTSYIIKQSGGEAKIWSTAQEGHVFTVIGGPDSAVERATVDFAEPEWKDAWIVDPWAGITCEAKDYTRMFERRMAQWEREGKTIWTSRSFGITGTFESPLDDAWIAEFREAKTPILKQP